MTRYFLLLVTACGPPAVAPVGNLGTSLPEPPARGTCPDVRSDFAPWMHQVFPQCPTEPFEYQLAICAGECPKPCRMTDGAQVYEIRYDDAGRWIENRGPQHRACSYDGQRMTTCSTPDSVSTLLYDPAGRLVRVEAAGHRIASIEYGETGRVAQFITIPDVITLVYDDAGRVVEEISALVGPQRYRYDAAGYVVAMEEEGRPGATYGYDDHHRLAHVIEDDRDDTFFYDREGRLAREVHRESRSSTSTHTYEYCR